jgi:hypothetical protein
MSTVIASEAKQSRGTRQKLDCFVASAPRNDELKRSRSPLNVIASAAKQSSGHKQDWIASSQALLEMTELNVLPDI